MKIKLTIIILLTAILLPVSVFAINAPTVDAPASAVNSNIYTLKIHTEPGAKITVVGGPRDLAPITDGAGNDAEDGIINFDVGLAQGKTNVFSIVAEKDGDISSGTVISITHDPSAADTEDVETPASQPDTTSPTVTSAGNQEEPEEERTEMRFGDTKGHWAEDYIGDLYKKEVISGKTPTKFDPNGYITRAELTKIAILSFGRNPAENLTENPFSDVDKGAWYAPYIKAAYDGGITHGNPDGTFKPNDFINRAAAIKIILRAAGVDAKSADNDFSDVKESDWFAPYVTYAYKNDIISGYSDGTFRPADNITRAEVAKIVVKIMEMNQ